MPEEPMTVFKFTAEGVDLEFAGSEEFVEKQVQRFRTFLEAAVGETAPTLDGSDGRRRPERAARPSRASTARRPTREGRGAIQDRILLFIYYLQHVQGKQAVSKEDIGWCFKQVGLGTPKNLLQRAGQHEAQARTTCRKAAGAACTARARRASSTSRSASAAGLSRFLSSGQEVARTSRDSVETARG